MSTREQLARQALIAHEAIGALMDMLRDDLEGVSVGALTGAQSGCKHRHKESMSTFGPNADKWRCIDCGHIHEGSG